jgi:TonB family protein
MLIWATRAFYGLTLRALFYGGLFLIVVMAQVGVTSALRSLGWNGGMSLLASGGVVLAIVLIGVQLGEVIGEKRAAARELERVRQNLPIGPCCVVWKAGDGEADMPWDIVDSLRAPYPKLARRIGVEGYAVVHFEISAEGRAKNIHCLDAWPSDVFYTAAKQALEEAQFVPKPGAQLRFGVGYHMPFVFRIAGAARLKDRGRKARPHRPALRAAVAAVEKLRRSA